jgi:hypothetical protein
MVSESNPVITSTCNAGYAWRILVISFKPLILGILMSVKTRSMAS